MYGRRFGRFLVELLDGVRDVARRRAGVRAELEEEVPFARRGRAEGFAEHLGLFHSGNATREEWGRSFCSQPTYLTFFRPNFPKVLKIIIS